MVKKFYIQQEGWKPFSYNDVEYSLSHLDEYSFQVTCSEGLSRNVLVVFSDHCFTKDRESPDEPRFPKCSRGDGVFCTTRHKLSLGIRTHITNMLDGKVWNAEGNSYALIPLQSGDGVKLMYSILFDLSKVTGVPFDLVMRIKSAHLRDETLLNTFGNVRFKHLVALRIQNKHPKKNYDRRRVRPR